MSNEPNTKTVYTAYPLGVPGRPYPMVYSGSEEDRIAPIAMQTGLPNSLNQKDHKKIGVLEEYTNPLMVHTSRPYAEMIGIAYREMPTPSMLPAFFEGLKQRDPRDPRKVQFILGTPGAGKSYMARTHNSMRSAKGGEFVDCGGKNLQELLFETVLDVPETFLRELESRIQKGSINPGSLAILKKGLGHAISEEEGRFSIDWSKIATPAEGTDHDTSLKKALEALERVRMMEGMDLPQGNSLGLKTQKGALIRAWEEGQEVILDEYNKCKPGSDSCLHDLWTLFNGRKETHTAAGGAGQSFTFRRKDMKPGFFVTLTGNTMRDGATTYDISTSGFSRLRPVLIGEPNGDDWQHRICQLLTGVPISTLYKSNPDYWNKHEDQFAQFLIDIRTLGMTPEDRKLVPDWQFPLLINWKKVLHATEHLASFYTQWNKCLDPQAEVQTALAGLSEEIDPQYTKMIAADLRMAERHIDLATCIVPNVRLVSQSGGYDTKTAWTSPPNTPTEKNEPVEREIGSRLTQIILDDVDRTTGALGKTVLHGHLKSAAQTHRLIPPRLNEAKANDLPTVASLLNVKDGRIVSTSYRTQILRDNVCKWLRHRHPQISINNDDIFTVSAFEEALQKAATTSAVTLGDRGMSLDLVNSKIETLSNIPIGHGASYDYALLQNTKPVEATKLVNNEQFLLSLALPQISGKNMNALWRPTFSNANYNGPNKAGINYAEGSEDGCEGLALTSVTCAKTENQQRRRTLLHILRDRNTNHTLIVGSTINPELRQFLQDHDITYVARQDTDAMAKVEATIERFIGTKANNHESGLIAAFKLRNTLNEDGERISPSTPAVDAKTESLIEEALQNPMDSDLGMELDDSRAPKITDADLTPLPSSSDLIDQLARLLVDHRLSTCSNPNYIAHISRENAPTPAQVGGR